MDIHTRNSHNKESYNKSDIVEVTIQDNDGVDVLCQKMDVQKNGSLTLFHSYSFTASKPGTYIVGVRLNGLELIACPYTCNVYRVTSPTFDRSKLKSSPKTTTTPTTNISNNLVEGNDWVIQKVWET